MRTVVTGGSGGLGSVVVEQLRARGVETVAASRRTGFDLQTGEGMDAILAHADVIVHAASHPMRYRRVDLDGTRRMISLIKSRAGRSSAPHIVYVSIVGCSRIPYPYYRAKYACELALDRSGLPVTVVRATQFHTLVSTLAGICSRGPIAVAPPMSFQSCDPRWVAGRLIDVAVSPPPEGTRRATDLAGPEVIGLGEAIELARPGLRQLRLPAVGGLLKAFAAGANHADADAEIGGSSYREWVAER